MTINEKLLEFERILDEYDKKYLLDKLETNLEVDDILGLKLNVIQKLSRDLCYAKAYILAEFSLVLQKEFNRQSAKNKWLEQKLSEVIATDGQQYGDKYTKFEVRRSMIIANNEYAKILGDYITTTSSKLESLNFLASRVNTMAEILRDFAKSKRE